MNYDDIVSSDRVVLVEFYATWCPHCRKMMPVVEQVRELLDGRSQVVQLDIDTDADAANDAGVESVPSFIVYRDGIEVWRNTGEMDGEVLLSRVESYI